MTRRPATTPTAFIAKLFGSIAKWPSTNVPPCPSASTKLVVTPVPSQKIEISRRPSRLSMSRSCSSTLPKKSLATPR